MNDMEPSSVIAPPKLQPDGSTKLSLDALLPESKVVSSDTGSRQKKPGRRRKRNHGRMMTLNEHLLEFRKRLVMSLVGIALMTVLGWMLSEQVFGVLQEPFLSAARMYHGQMSITFNGVASAFNTRLQIGLFIGVVSAAPWWLYQIWAFINPGLKSKERWTAIIFIAASVPLFLLGAALAWIFLPQAIAVLSDFAPAHTATLLSADVYFTFILRMTLAFGIAFLLPVVMVALTVVDLVQWQTWLKQWRIAVVVAFVFAAVATPTGDIGTLCGLGLPICGIYFLAILVCYLYCQAQMLKIWFLLQRDTWTIRCHSVIQHIQYVYERAAIYISDFLKRKGK